MPNLLKSILGSFKNPEQTWLSFVIEMMILISIVLFIRFYVFQFFQVSGPSMCPTLNELNDGCLNGKGEFVFVNQATYKFIRPPEVGEVVVFRPPTDTKDYYIKRIMGVPGDVIKVYGGKVYKVNEDGQDVLIEEPYLSARNQGRTQTSLEVFTVPEGKYVLFGDNRDRSLDSRRCYGATCSGDATPYVSLESIKGKAEFVIWPFWTMRWMENPFKEVSS